MFSFKRSGIFLPILLCFILALSGTVSAAGPASFPDVPDSHWALPHIIKMQLRGVITGYGDGSFKPDNYVSQLEAVTMAVRAMGLQDETEKEHSIDVSRYDLPVSWNAAGYVKVALLRGIIDADNFSPYSNAGRAWVAQMVIRMIDAEDELREEAATNFDDDASIPKWAKKHVALAVDKGIITGVANSTGGYDFLPDNAVKRAELATMISRADRYMNEVKGQLPMAEVTAVEGSRVSLKQTGNVVQAYNVVSTTAIFDKNAKRSTASILKPGELIRYQVNEQGDFIFIEQLNKDHYQYKYISGTVIRHFKEDRLVIIQSGDGKLHTNRYADGSGAELLQPGTFVTATVKDDTIVSIKYDDLQGSVLRGKFYFLDKEKNILTLETNNRHESFTVSDNVIFNYGGKRFPSVQDLVKGDEIEITLKDNEIISITLLKEYNRETLSCKIVAISPIEKVLTVRAADGRLISVEVPDNAVITIGGMANPLFSDLEVGDDIELTVEKNAAVALTVTNRGYKKEVTGKVEALNASTRVIVLEDEQGNLNTYRIDEAVYLDLGKSQPKLSDITVGMTITLKLEDNIVYEITRQNKVVGKLEQIDGKRNQVTVNTAGGRKNYNIGGAVIRISGITYPTINHLEAGQQVQLTLLDGRVVMVEVIITKLGTVASIDSSRNRFEVKEGSLTSRYDINPGTAFIVRGISSPSLRDLKVGDAVYLTIVGKDLQQVEVVPAQLGYVVSVSLQAGKIIVQTGSSQEIIDINDKLTVYSGTGGKMPAVNLKEQDYVKIVSTDDETIVYQSQVLNGEVVVIDPVTRSIYIMDETKLYQWFSLVKDLSVWKGSSDSRLEDLAVGSKVKLYLFDNQVYGIRINEN
jgi:hypothetical protein